MEISPTELWIWPAEIWTYPANMVLQVKNGDLTTAKCGMDLIGLGFVQSCGTYPSLWPVVIGQMGLFETRAPQDLMADHLPHKTTIWGIWFFWTKRSGKLITANNMFMCLFLDNFERTSPQKLFFFVDMLTSKYVHWGQWMVDFKLDIPPKKCESNWSHGYVDFNGWGIPLTSEIIHHRRN